MNKERIAKTPLEEALERELRTIGLPFKERILYHEVLFENSVVVQQYEQKDFEQMSPLVRDGIRRRQKTIEYFQAIVYRSTAWSSTKKLSVGYTIFPSDENITAFRRAAWKEIPKVVDRVLKERSFATEQVQIHDNANCPITQELIDTLREDARSPWLTRDYLKKVIANRRKSNRDDPEEVEYGESHFLYVEFEGSKLATDQGCDVPRDLFEGITSPVEHATLLAQRIAGFIAKIEGTK